jgi:hypothetical protein
MHLNMVSPIKSSETYILMVNLSWASLVSVMIGYGTILQTERSRVRDPMKWIFKFT